MLSGFRPLQAFCLFEVDVDGCGAGAVFLDDLVVDQEACITHALPF